jgi:hypothetical protein
MSELVDIIRRLVDVDPYTGDAGFCRWCGGGWEETAGPHGGKVKWRHTAAHASDCVFAEAKELVR